MQLNVNRRTLIEKLNTQVQAIETAAQTELERLQLGLAQIRAAELGHADYFQAVAEGLRDGTIELGNGGELRSKSELPQSPRGLADRRHWIEVAQTKVNAASTASVEAIRASLTLLEMSPDELVGIESEHYENLLRVLPNFREISARIGARID